MENDEDEDTTTYQENEILGVNPCDYDYKGDNLILHDNTQPGVEVELEGDEDDEANDDIDDGVDDDILNDIYDTIDEEGGDTRDNINITDNEDGDSFDESD